MRARFAFVDAMQKVNTRASVEAQKDNLFDMLRLCHSDNMGVRDIVPSLLLRLAQDQECYNFIKWWESVYQESNYDWGHMDLPYLDVKDADVFEPVDFLCNEFPTLNSIVAITLLKMELLLDLKDLQDQISVNTEELYRNSARNE